MSRRLGRFDIRHSPPDDCSLNATENAMPQTALRKAICGIEIVKPQHGDAIGAALLVK